MHTATTAQKTPSSAPPRDLIVGEPGSAVASASDPRFAQYKVIRRNGAVVGFEPAKITIAMAKAFLAVHGGQGAASSRVRDEVTKLTDAVVAALMKRKPEGGAIHIEEIQDQVELALMRGGEHEVARAYVLYREKRAQERAQEKQQKGGKAPEVKIFVTDNGVRKPLDLDRLTDLVKTSCAGLTAADPERILKATQKDLYDGVPMEEVRKCLVLAARTLIEKDPAYSYVTARLLLDALRFEAIGEEVSQAGMTALYATMMALFHRERQHDLRLLLGGKRKEEVLRLGGGQLSQRVHPVLGREQGPGVFELRQGETLFQRAGVGSHRDPPA